MAFDDVAARWRLDCPARRDTATDVPLEIEKSENRETRLRRLPLRQGGLRKPAAADRQAVSGR